MNLIGSYPSHWVKGVAYAGAVAQDMKAASMLFPQGISWTEAE